MDFNQLCASSCNAILMWSWKFREGSVVDRAVLIASGAPGQCNALGPHHSSLTYPHPPYLFIYKDSLELFAPSPWGYCTLPRWAYALRQHWLLTQNDQPYLDFFVQGGNTAQVFYAVTQILSRSITKHGAVLNLSRSSASRNYISIPTKSR